MTKSFWLYSIIVSSAIRIPAKIGFVHKVTVSTEEVKKIAKLASLKLPDNEIELFSQQFTETVDVINQLNEIDTSTVPETYQVTGLSNITREDEVDENRVLPQEVALREAKLIHEGFFVVPRVIDTDETESVI
ncbi:MAG: Aspartyl/glutamyl-tRNA(Asn/Gln) amidotransferase subunit C [Candidatus Collierbacteria bacterium GW2011_GWB1_44_6]|uniref:Aspartyl/glutamyl-tRNA(Asn/Gln) amidotransferase subunit C n=2 Tax=Candidatus Collieribacteriota TaxID=1752725 RepID=A0A0G1JQI1_9BACT|nr:MAG: Aspartyl/glutamyl-tRNA(Asn/Gln) amidotransferase subunit C [Candidatus Collierbacteria bacterium GW2011_GWC2_43_12]KKT73613.1 MAG: Aspartyl/glutamyl-tRNA(Asn/Gln) amidotransferase subunit C [Candidatus Collierbacteria bacterium GW2011_GWB1_44_6]KKT84166.1 MAG: aspartyl-tRNA(Asn)/glutamyl-tRNA (Gln) amidotransferase subunit C, aspartyl-tRNA(Asn)/glutamyl-tRNA (Gln) amidotransferase subunit C [Microgenomates group bacterium GW2011_GWC1_44_9]